MTELCVIHPGELSPLCWPRIARHLPSGTRLRVLELEALNGYWEHDPSNTVDGMADRLRLTLDPRHERVLVGWGVGGVVAESLAARLTRAPRNTILLDTVAPGGVKPSDADIFRSFAMLVGARRGRPAGSEADTLDGLIDHLADRGFGSAESLRKHFFQHQRGRQYDHRLIAAHTPLGVPITVVQPADSLADDLGWEHTNLVEPLASGGDHYTMLTDPAHAVNLALLLTRWLTRPLAAAS